MELVFNRDNDKYTARTRKGSRIIVKEYPLGWDWWIDEGKEFTPLSTYQQHEIAAMGQMKGNWETAEEAIASFISITNSIYNTQLTWKIE